MKRLLLIAPIVLLLIGSAVWWFSTTQVLKRRTHSFLETITLAQGSGKGGRQMKTYALNGYLAPTIELSNPSLEQVNGSFERAEIESGFSWLANQAVQTRFEIREMQAITSAGDQGSVTFLLDALVELPGFRPADGLQQVTFTWQKFEDNWRVTRITWEEQR